MGCKDSEIVNYLLTWPAIPHQESTLSDTRIIGTFISDKDATMEYLRSSGKFTEEKLNILSGLLGKLIMECDMVNCVSTMDAYISVEPLRILERTDEYIIVASQMLGEMVTSKLVFTEDGYWHLGNEAPGCHFREKFVRIGHPAEQSAQKQPTE